MSVKAAICPFCEREVRVTLEMRLVPHGCSSGNGYRIKPTNLVKQEKPTRTDHSYYISLLRDSGAVGSFLAADLLELHDQTGISLDNWETAQEFIIETLNNIGAEGYVLLANGA